MFATEEEPGCSQRTDRALTAVSVPSVRESFEESDQILKGKTSRDPRSLSAANNPCGLL
jgi:hypothetical protein